MKLIVRSMLDGHQMGEVTARTDNQAKHLAAEQLKYRHDEDSGTGDDDIAGLYGPRGGFHGCVNLPRCPRGAHASTT